MLKKISFLLVFLMSFCGLVSANTPYASILAYNQNAYNVGVSKDPNMNIISKLNIINLTPWEIYIGDPTSLGKNDMLQGFSGPDLGPPVQPVSPVTPFWLKGVNAVYNSSNPNSPSSRLTGFAFHSIQIGLNNPNNAWIQAINCPVNPSANTSIPLGCYNSFDMTTQASTPQAEGNPYWSYYLSETGYLTIPIVFNSSSGKPGNNTASLNFMVTSSNGFAQVATVSEIGSDAVTYTPAYALSSGDGANNYAWATQATYNGNTKSAPAQTQAYNVSQFLTIQAAGSNANKWTPVATALNGATFQPAYLNTAALAYPGFSNYSGVTAVPGAEYDLVVMLQSGDYADLSLIFLATPSSASSAVKRK